VQPPARTSKCTLYQCNRSLLQRALFGDKAVAQLCKGFDFTTSDARMVIVDFAVFKQTDCALVGKNLTKLLNLLHVLPISSAECERGFSQMNLYHTKGRNRLLVSSMNDMLMVGINGPLLETWNAAKYVVSWLKAGHHGALDGSTKKESGCKAQCEAV